MKISLGAGGDFPVLEQDTYLARLRIIAAIGMQNGMYGPKDQVIFTWEVFCDDIEGDPCNLSSFYNLSFNEKSNLYKDLNGFAPKFAAKVIEDINAGKDVDLSALLNAPALVTVDKIKKEDGSYKNKIMALTKIMKGTEVPKLINATIYFDLDDSNWQETIKSIPEWQQKLVNPNGAGTVDNEPAIAGLDSDLNSDDDAEW